MNDNIGIRMIIPVAKLDINGPIYQRGGELHADFVFELGYQLELIDEHSEYMWQHKHLGPITEAKVGENARKIRKIVELGVYRKVIVEELEKAHIYIEQLYNRLKVLEEKLAKLENKAWCYAVIAH